MTNGIENGNGENGPGGESGPGPFPLLFTSNFGFNPFTKEAFTSKIHMPNNLAWFELGGSAPANAPYAMIITRRGGYDWRTGEAWTITLGPHGHELVEIE